jgi:hypothetical protein
LIDKIIIKIKKKHWEGIIANFRGDYSQFLRGLLPISKEDTSFVAMADVLPLREQADDPGDSWLNQRKSITMIDGVTVIVGTPRSGACPAYVFCARK